MVQPSSRLLTPKAAKRPRSTLRIRRDVPAQHRREEVTDVESLYGRYGYYLQCRACATKKTVPQKCEVCDGKAKLRKKGACFYRDCETCATQNLLHINPNPSSSG